MIHLVAAEGSAVVIGPSLTSSRGHMRMQLPSWASLQFRHGMVFFYSVESTGEGFDVVFPDNSFGVLTAQGYLFGAGCFEPMLSRADFHVLESLC